MILFPAIDLRDGACVRLEQGDFSRATVFSRAPSEQARAWQQAGFRWLHVVDLDGAVAGKPVNDDAVRGIVSAVSIPVQLGGGIRSLADVARWLDAGVARVILGSMAAREPAVVREACRLHPGRIVLGIDARAGRVAVAGWGEAADLDATDLALRFEEAGAAAIVYTDIARDGMLGGLDVAGTVALAGRVRIPVIASGGVGSLDHLRALRSATQDAGVTIEGVVVGRALYDGRLDPAGALALLDGRDERQVSHGTQR